MHISMCIYALKKTWTHILAKQGASHRLRPVLGISNTTKKKELINKISYKKNREREREREREIEKINLGLNNTSCRCLGPIPGCTG
jgi:hypothetical protein